MKQKYIQQELRCPKRDENDKCYYDRADCRYKNYAYQCPMFIKHRLDNPSPLKN